jgi:hypothetical protein
MKQHLAYLLDRIKSLVMLTLVGCVFAMVVFLCAAETDIRHIINNLNGLPQTIHLRDILENKFNNGKYIEVSGMTDYDVAMEGTRDNKTTIVQRYYLLYDMVTHDGVMVLAPDTNSRYDNEYKTVIGILSQPDSKAYPILEKIASGLKGRNLNLDTQQIILEGYDATPPQIRLQIFTFLTIWGAFFFIALTLLVASILLPYKGS